VIVAHLPHHRLKAGWPAGSSGSAPHRAGQIYARQRAAIERAGLGSEWSEFRAALSEIKENGYAVTTGEFNLRVRRRGPRPE
jgi:DNA-binding IclR family transcriptional regulator